MDPPSAVTIIRSGTGVFTRGAERRGDQPGHDFHGNQWTGGIGGSPNSKSQIIGFPGAPPRTDEWSVKQREEFDRFLKKYLKELDKEGDGTREHPLHAQTPEEAIEAILAGKWVWFDDLSDVAILMDKIAEMTKEAEEKGEKAPEINL